MSKVIRRRKSPDRKHQEGGSRNIGVLSDAERFEVLTRYSKGQSVSTIGVAMDIFSREISTFITTHLQALNSTREANKLLDTHGLNTPKVLPTPEEMSKDFLEREVPEKCLDYAYYFGLTGDNGYALKSSGLDKSIIAKQKSNANASYRYSLKSRGIYLRSLPSVREEIDRVRRTELAISSVDKPFLITEIVEQLNQAKEIAIDDPTQRRHTIALLRMLGDSIPDAFSHNIKVSEINPEDSLQTLIEMAEKDTVSSTYTIEDNLDE